MKTIRHEFATERNRPATASYYLPKFPVLRYWLSSRIFWLLVILLTALWYAVDYEVRTSYWQARWITPYSQAMQFALEEGPQYLVAYPTEGPFDHRLGYVRLPADLERLHKQGLRIDRQARFSPELFRHVMRGLNPPYQEKDQAGLRVLDCAGTEFYRFDYPERTYRHLDEVPPAILNALLFIEDRELMQPESPEQNPVINWGRLTKAVLLKAGEAIDLDVPTIGGSTLATQIEKYRHSPDGITGSSSDKLRQIVSATIRAYHEGKDTREIRRRLALSYLNTVPLAAAPGYGEVNSLGDGLWVWMGADFDTVNRLLTEPPGEGNKLRQQGLAMRQVVALMIAHRRPSYYLYQDRDKLEDLTASYLRLMGSAGLIPPRLMWAALEQPLQYRNFRQSPAVRIVASDKGVNVVRNRLGNMLQVSLYDLDRLDLTVRSTLSYDLQQAVTNHLEHLSEESFAIEKGLTGQYLLKPGQARHINYSFTLFELTDAGNLVRVQTDNTANIFDINEGSKLELGSTAKLRVTTTYLEIIAELHQRYAGLSQKQLEAAWREAEDVLSRWVIEQLSRSPDLGLAVLLDAALDRQYSAGVAERFFTGGGVMQFSNFQTKDNGRIATVRESFRDSLNLPFVRLLRDIISHLSGRLWEDFRMISQDDRDPRRQAFLNSFIEQESRQYLNRFWRKYVSLSPQERLETFLSGIKPGEVRLAAIHRYIYPEADFATFKDFMVSRQQDKPIKEKTLASLYANYGPGKFHLQDQGYIARVHPLELWVLAYLQSHPEPSLKAAIEASSSDRQLIYRWLYTNKAKNARDKRVRIALEVEAFGELARRWRRVGYPFDHLVPSLATALGSSGDRPAALAVLMGILVNDGQRVTTKRVTDFHYAAQTPYETVLSNPAANAEQVLKPEVAAAMRGLLSLVTNQGTARRLQGAYTSTTQQPLATGGKTGTGDNRLVQVGPGGQRVVAKALNRTATFVFFLGDRFFGTLTAFVLGEAADEFRFTSALPVQVLKSMSPILNPVVSGGTLCQAPLAEPADWQTQTWQAAADMKAGSLPSPTQ